MKTRKAFYRALRKIAPNYTWTITHEDIRGTSKTDYNDAYPFCPITAVAKPRLKINEPVSSSEAWTLGPRLGLSEDVINEITEAADYDRTDRKSKAIRRAIKRAVGLS